MIPALPLGFAATLRGLLVGLGEDVQFLPAEPPGSPGISVRASVQAPGSAILTGDAMQEGFMVYIAPADLPGVTPQRFDRVMIRGEARTVEEAHSHVAAGENLMWVLLVRG